MILEAGGSTLVFLALFSVTCLFSFLKPVFQLNSAQGFHHSCHFSCPRSIRKSPASPRSPKVLSGPGGVVLFASSPPSTLLCIHLPLHLPPDPFTFSSLHMHRCTARHIQSASLTWPSLLTLSGPEVRKIQLEFFRAVQAMPLTKGIPCLSRSLGMQYSWEMSKGSQKP